MNNANAFVMEFSSFLTHVFRGELLRLLHLVERPKRHNVIWFVVIVC